MSLPSAPPLYANWAAMVTGFSRDHAKAWQAFAVQSVVGVGTDGVFGVVTEDAIKRWQANHKDAQGRALVADGKVGPLTQAAMLRVVSAEVDTHFSTLPDGLLNGFARTEGVNLLAATNWSVKGGVDCGCIQLRIYVRSDGSYPLETTTVGTTVIHGLKEAFNPRSAFVYAARSFTGRITSYKQFNPTGLGIRRIIEAAVLAHNWPAGASQIMKFGHVLNGSDPATWTFNKAAGRPYTREEWSHEYPSRVLSGVDY